MHLDPNEMDDEQQAAVWTMLKYFKAKGLTRAATSSSRPPQAQQQRMPRVPPSP